MKFDMHCHTKEGSIDSKVSLEKYILLLKAKGFGGMVITDHNSYNGYRHWKNNLKDKKHTDFVVLKGIEYDTINSGHMLIIMPEGVKPRILELRGMPISLLITIVHTFGGILGPAHPCGEKYLSYANTKSYRKNRDLLKKFDFIETFNACESPERNEAAKALAKHYQLPGIGGSDAHKEVCVGYAYTELPDSVTCESELITYVKSKPDIHCGGSYYRGTTKEKMGRINRLLVYSFWVYNKTAGFLKVRKRRSQSKFLKVNMGDGSSSCKRDLPSKA